MPCRHAKLLNSLLVAFKLCCFVQVELSWLSCLFACSSLSAQRRTWSYLGCSHLFSCMAAFLPLLSSSSSGQGGAPSLSSLQLCSKEMLLCPKEEETAQNSVAFWMLSLLICHINWGISEVGNRLSSNCKFPCLGLKGCQTAEMCWGTTKCKAKAFSFEI